MPRPKSELTKNFKLIGIRLLPKHYEEWRRLGGVKWIREQLQKSLDSK